jgi:uncharacterized protein YdaU (DUF1376 family)
MGVIVWQGMFCATYWLNKMKTSPAFMFYASDAMADRRYRLMTLAERGLYISMLCECWVNFTVPSNKSQLAKLLGYQEVEIEANLTERLLSHFYKSEPDLASSDLASFDIEKYRKEVLERRAKLEAAGKRGAQAKQDKAQNDASHPSSHPSRVAEASRDEMKGVEKRREEKSLESVDNYDEFVNDYESYEKAEPR